MIKAPSFLLFSCFLIFLLSSCASIPLGSFDGAFSNAPDYSKEKYWCALPSVHDSADAVPVEGWHNVQDSAEVDVFFIHPTTYIGKNNQNKWNAAIGDAKCNLDVDKGPIRYQATIFNGSGKIYAPRYRQAHLNCFYTNREADARKAIELAYADIKMAFEYYLQHFNGGRPFIIAGHSQGSLHGMNLLKEYIDGKPLQNRMVAAYLPGWAIPINQYQTIKPCLSPDDVGCFCSWRTVRKNYLPRKMHLPGKQILVTNPVTWKLNGLASGKEEHLGGVFLDFKTLRPRNVRVWTHQDFLWSTKPRFPGSFLWTKRNYHIADYNLFYADVRKNAQDRVQRFLEMH